MQWAGTLAFNVSTFATLVAGLSTSQQKKLVWAPDFYGSALFLASSVLALVALGMVVATRRDRGIAWLNMIGSIMFGVAAVAAFVLPTTGEPINIRWVNAGHRTRWRVLLRRQRVDGAADAAPDERSVRRGVTPPVSYVVL